MDLGESDSDDEELITLMGLMQEHQRRTEEGLLFFGMYQDHCHYNKGKRIRGPESGEEWVFRTLADPPECHNMFRLGADNIKPLDPDFPTIHPRLRQSRFRPYFNGCIGAIDGTHIPVVVDNDKVAQYICRKGYTSQNVLAVCDFDMRFTFVLAGWPGSVHDMRVFRDATTKYTEKFPHPPEGKFYLVDSGYPNKPGYLAPYKGTKYHLPEF
ncbi:hypothetical protein ACP70R_029083 [Stipagrostis hirtigluma subsp. patula]